MRHTRKRWLLVLVVGVAAIALGGSARANTPGGTVCPTGDVVFASPCPVYPAATPTCSKTPATTPAHFAIDVGSWAPMNGAKWSVTAYNSDNTVATSYNGCAQYGLN